MKERLQFSLKYTVITLLVIAVLFYIVRSVWYPSFYFTVLNVGNIFVILSGTVIVIGPLLSLIVYKADKHLFTKDLFVILLLQLTALLLGVKVLYSERPLFLVFSVDRFVVITANSIDQSKISPDVSMEALESDEPLVVAAYLPRSVNLTVMIDVMNGAPDIEFRPGLYEPIQYQIESIKERGVKMDAVLAMFPRLTDELNLVKIDNVNAMAYPLVNLKGQDMLLFMDIDRLRPIKIANVAPWELLNSL